MSIIDDIISTKAYAKMSFIQQNIVVKHHNRQLIEHGLLLSKNIGLEKCIAEKHFSNLNKNIIIELHQKENK